MTSKLKILIFTAVAAAMSCVCLGQAPTGTYYFPDKPFPEFMHLWQEGWAFKDAQGNKLIYARPDMLLGGYAFIYYKNTTNKPITVSDLTIEGIKMSEALRQEAYPQRAEEKYRSSILISKVPKSQLDKLIAAGWPAWWKPEPATVDPGRFGKIVIRLKRNPQLAELSIGIIYEGGRFTAKVSTNKPQPRFATIAFTPDLRTIHLYAKHPKVGAKLLKIFLDNENVTKFASIVSDPSLDTSAIVLKIPEPLKVMSYYNFKATYADGSSAQAGIRAWGREMVYGMWSSPSGGTDSKKATEDFIREYLLHNINAVMPYVVGVCRDFFNSDEGWEYCEKMGVGRMVHWPHEKYDALFLFAMDEPDAHDAAWQGLPAQDRLGGYGQWLVNWTRVLQKRSRSSPVLLNINNTYKPENWYMYHQLADIPCVDPYFPEQQDFCWNKEPYHFSAHTRPTYVKGVCTISQSSGQPNPLHVILCSTRYGTANGYMGRYPTPEEKRMEVYYAVGCGAKGLSYWWFARDSYCHGLDERTPEANALWREIGILGAEVRTAGPLITTSCPIELPVQANKFLWVSPLLCGSETLAVVVVNENVACDRLGTVFKPIENAKVRVKLPSWITPKSVFEVTSDGVKDVASKRDGSSLTLDLGAVDLSRFVVITSNTGLKLQLQKRYDQMFVANVKKLKHNSP